MKIDIHADDYAESMHTSEDILSLCKDGLLDSVSIVPNMTCFDESVRLYKEAMGSFPKPVAVVVHINLMEGHCVAPKEQVSDLVDENGYFSLTWGSLLLSSCNPLKRSRIRKQLETEIAAQIEKIWQTGLISDGVRIDSHQHPHHIPVVRDAIFGALSRGNHTCVFIRNSREPVSVWLSNPRLLFSCRPINWVKTILLNTLSIGLERKFKKEGLATGYLCGVMMSGKMDGRVLSLKKSLESFARKKDAHLEILFHPGTLLQSEIGDEYSKPDAVKFYVSGNRATEYETVRAIGELPH